MLKESGERGDSLSNLRRAVKTGLNEPHPILSEEERKELESILHEEE